MDLLWAAVSECLGHDWSAHTCGQSIRAGDYCAREASVHKGGQEAGSEGRQKRRPVSGTALLPLPPGTVSSDKAPPPQFSTSPKCCHISTYQGTNPLIWAWSIISGNAPLDPATYSLLIPRHLSIQSGWESRFRVGPHGPFSSQPQVSFVEGRRLLVRTASLLTDWDWLGRDSIWQCHSLLSPPPQQGKHREARMLLSHTKPLIYTSPHATGHANKPWTLFHMQQNIPLC